MVWARWVSPGCGEVHRPWQTFPWRRSPGCGGGPQGTAGILMQWWRPQAVAEVPRLWRRSSGHGEGPQVVEGVSRLWGGPRQWQRSLGHSDGPQAMMRGPRP